MHILDAIVRLLSRPFGFDLYVGKWAAWSDFKAYQLGVERLDAATLRAWVGPLHIATHRL